MKKCLVILASLCTMAGTAALAQSSAQQPSAQQASVQQAASTQTTSVFRTTKAVNYRLRGDAIKIDFHGTELMQNASGEAKVTGKKSNVEIDAKFDGLDDPTKFGLEYLSLVLWAISPEGRAVNLGELVIDHNSSHVKAITDMQTFGMIVTAEPYFAVNQPGNMVVMENIVGATTVGRQENIDAKYELLGRGTYSATNTKIQDAIFGIDRKTPRVLFEARNAVRIASLAQADKYAPSIQAKAAQKLRDAEEAYVQKRDKSTIETLARDTVSTAEEARVMSVKQKAEEEAQAKAAADKKAAEDREAKARQDALDEAKRRQEAEVARQQAEQARQQALAAQADAERMKAEADKARQDAEKARQEADAARAAAEQQKQALAVEAEKARQAAEESDRLRQQAEKEKADLRAQLLQQLNQVLATRDTARGLIANMSDVLFKTGSFELLPGARERLAKVSGIVIAHPGLRLEVEGHTDSVGGDDYNQQLSEKRAGAVRDYLIQQGISADGIISRGLGKTQPVATNDTPEGRQQNRRVELVLSGDAIGMKTADASTPGATGTTQK
ncbi:MAG TPA: OmpA family protein [Candidatus Angelobacter sp.]|nr:OmpA family protein [Candidatus Angelobacter sp.]